MSEFGRKLEREWEWRDELFNRKASEKQRGADQPPGENHHALTRLTSKHDTDARSRASERASIDDSEGCWSEKLICWSEKLLV